MDAAELPNLLLVEDSQDDEKLSLRGISRSGIPCDVTVRRDGAAALDYLLGASGPLPNLIVLDYRLPKVNGLEVLTQVRLNAATRCIPVVIFSGTNVGSELTECYRVGANSCVMKPVDAKEYVSRLVAIMEYWLCLDQASVHRAQ